MTQSTSMAMALHTQDGLLLFFCFFPFCPPFSFLIMSGAYGPLFLSSPSFQFQKQIDDGDRSCCHYLLSVSHLPLCILLVSLFLPFFHFFLFSFLSPLFSPLYIKQGWYISAPSIYLCIYLSMYLYTYLSAQFALRAGCWLLQALIDCINMSQNISPSLISDSLLLLLLLFSFPPSVEAIPFD